MVKQQDQRNLEGGGHQLDDLVARSGVGADLLGLLVQRFYGALQGVLQGHQERV